jgi:TolB protein
VADLFLSYAHEDEARMRPLAAAFEARGWTVFWDRRIPAGSTWRSHIGTELHHARCVLVAWSRDSISSRWVLEEADDAQARGVLLPILLDAVAPPIGFRSIQAADLTRWNPDRGAAGLDQLFRDIETILHTAPDGGTAPGEPRAAGESAGTNSSPATRHVPRTWLLIAVVSLLAVVGGTAWYLMGGERTPSGSPSGGASSPRSANDNAQPPPTRGDAVASVPGSRNERAETTPPRIEPRPEAASSATRIGFISNRDGEPAMYIMETDGSAQQRLSPPGSSDVALAWSPDGERIAFISNRGGRWSLQVMNADGGPAADLGEARGHERPAWSPDGNKLAFAADVEGNSDIYVIAELRGSTRRRLTSEPSRETSPSWAPDGLHIAFTSNRDGTSEVYVMNADGTDQKRLTSPPTAAVDVAWSPDGKSLAYVTRSGLFVMNADGSNARGLVTNRRAQAVSWSPDSRQLVFQGAEGKSFFGIFTVNADGTNVRNLTRTPGAADYRPVWSPRLRKPRRDR